MTLMRPLQRRWMRQAWLVGTLAALSCSSAQAYESDVHYGLTRWLALRAGFNESQAEAVAVANQRVDGGLIEMQWLNLEYACSGRFADQARQFQSANYPSAKAVPGPLAERIVVAGSDAARQALASLKPLLKGKEGLLLGKLGEALHPLQDSWSHQGTPSSPDLGHGLGCDDQLISAPPVARGGPQSHASDVTAGWPSDTLAMARASYEVLLAYPSVEGQTRQAAAWDELAPAVEAFAKATSKTQKRSWFNAQGIADTTFIEGMSLPDGPAPGPLTWRGRKLLPLPGSGSTQHDAPVDVRAFFDRLLARWLGGERTEDIVAEMGPLPGHRASLARDLAARLGLWRLRDHGSAATLAHAPAPLTASQLRAAEALTRDKHVAWAPTSISDAVFPLMPSGPAAAPLVPYILRELPAANGRDRWLAILRFRHAPYDSVGCIVEHEGARWVLTALVAAIDQ